MINKDSQTRIVILCQSLISKLSDGSQSLSESELLHILDCYKTMPFNDYITYLGSTFRDEDIAKIFYSFLFKQFTTYSESLPLLLVYDKIIIGTNNAGQKLFQLDSIDILGMNILSIFPLYQPGGLNSSTIVSSILDEDSKETPIDCEILVSSVLKSVTIFHSSFILQGEIRLTEYILLESSYLKSQIYDLTKSEAQFKIIAENTPGLTKVSNSTNNYYYFNKGWRQFLNEHDNNILSKVWIDYVHPDDIIIVLRTIDSAFKKRTSYRIEYRLRNYLGDYFYFEDIGDPIFDNRNIFNGYISSCIDVTDAKRLSQLSNQLQIKKLVDEEIIRNIEHTQTIILGIGKSDKIRYYNSFAKENLNYVNLDIDNSFFSIFYIFEFSAQDSVYAFFARNVGQKITAHTLTNNVSDYIPKVYNFTAIYISTNDGIEDSTIYLIAEDVSEVEKHKLSVKIKDQKLQDLLSSMQDLYFKVDRNFILTEVNDNAYELLGYQPNEIIGKSIEDKVIQVSRSTFTHILNHRTLSTITLKLVDKQGNRLFFNCKIKIILDFDGKLYFVGIARDVSDMLKTQFKLVQKNKRITRLAEIKDQFLANMSHEIRTPLNGMIGLIDLLSVSDIKFPESEYIKTIRDSSNTLLRIINDILDLSKFDSDLFILKESVFALDSIIVNLVDLYKPICLNKGISIDWNIQSEIPPNLKGDNVRLTQILGNLLSNSIKFTYEGHVKLEVSLVTFEGLKCMLKFNIIDTGIGIDEASQSKLFQAFSQLDSSQSKSEQGTGLGLHISQKLISLMGGSITFTSIIGVGSTFSVYLPFLVELGSLNKLDKVPILDYEQDILDNICILVIDDNSTNLKVAYSLLQHCGATVTTALSGLEGLHKVIENSVVFDYVLLDIQMPIIDGIETFMLFKTIANFNKPIIALTAYSMLGDRERYLNIGFTSYLAKPITIESIVNLFRNRMDWNYDVMDHDSLGSSYLINLKQVNGLLLILGLDNFLASLTDLDSEFYVLLYELKVNEADLARILHTIKGSVSTMGLAKLADIASFYENSYKKYSIINVDEAHDVLASIYLNSIKFVHTIISSSSYHGKDSIDS